MPTPRPSQNLTDRGHHEPSPGHAPARSRPSLLPGSLMLAALSLGLSSCATRHGDPSDLDGPVFGSSRPTTFVVAPADGNVHVRDLAKIARVLRRYKTLDAAERALVKTTVGKRLQGLIAIEVQRIEINYRAQREQISRLPDKAVAAKRLAELDRTINREAIARVAERLGQFIAVPLKTSDNRSAVAFAKISGTGIEVARDAGEIDLPIAALVDGEGVKTETGRVASYVKTPGVPVAPAP